VQVGVRDADGGLVGLGIRGARAQEVDHRVGPLAGLDHGPEDADPADPPGQQLVHAERHADFPVAGSVPVT
jgi:hypothetical protein